MLDLNFVKERQNKILSKFAIEEGDNLLPDEIVKVLNYDNVYVYNGCSELFSATDEDGEEEFIDFNWATLCFFPSSEKHYNFSFRWTKNSIENFKQVFEYKVRDYFSKKPEITDIDFIDINLIVDDVMRA